MEKTSFDERVGQRSPAKSVTTVAGKDEGDLQKLDHQYKPGKAGERRGRTVARPRLFCFVLAKPAESPIRHEYETSMMMVLVSHSLRRPMRSTSVAPAIDTNKFHNAARGNGQSSRDESEEFGRTETTIDRCLLFRIGYADEAKDGRLRENLRLVMNRGRWEAREGAQGSTRRLKHR